MLTNVEGFLQKLCGKRVKSWRRRYFVLGDGLLTYYEDKPTIENGLARRPLGVVELSAFSVVRASRSSKSFTFELVARPHVLVLRAESAENEKHWEKSLRKAIDEARYARKERKSESRRGWLTKRAVSSQRNWKNRFFVLRNGRLAYYENKPSSPTERPKGMFEITADAVIRHTSATVGWGKNNAFIVETGPAAYRHTLQLSAPTPTERAAWMWSLHVTALRKAGIFQDEGAVKVGVWLHEHALEKYATGVVLDSGIKDFDKIKRMSEDDMKVLFRQVGFTMNDARKFQSSVKELRSLSASQMDMLGAPLGFKTNGSVVGGDDEDIGILEEDDDEDYFGVDEDMTIVSSDEEDDVNAKPMSASINSLRGGHLSKKFSAGTNLARSDSSVQGGLWQRLSMRSTSQKSANLSHERRVYTWGDNSLFQLGIGSGLVDTLTSNPHHVQTLKKKTESRVLVAGESCVASISEKDGQLFTWGSGPLGIQTKSSSNRPFLVTALRKVNIVCVSIGEEHAGAVSSAGDLYMWGEGPSGELGLGLSRKESREPALVEYIGTANGVPVKTLSCGIVHTIVVAQGDSVYTMGKGRHGRLGLGDQDNRYVPTLVDSLEGHKIDRVAAGNKFSLAVTENGMKMFMWGRIGPEPGSLVPVRMHQFDDHDRPILDIAASNDMAIIVVGDMHGRNTVLSSMTAPKYDDGECIDTSVYTMGTAASPLGFDGVQEDIVDPRLLESLEGENVVQVSCSSTHAAGLCQDGRLLMWGNDERGALASGYFISVRKPMSTRRVNGYRYTVAACGGHFTAALGEFDPSAVEASAGASTATRSVETTSGVIGELTQPPPPPPPDLSAAPSNKQDRRIIEKIGEITQLLKDVKSDPGPQLDSAGYPLPKGSRLFNSEWIEHRDRRTGKLYYENMETQEVQWNRPENKA